MRAGLAAEGSPAIGPAEGVGGLVEGGDEGADALAQGVERGEVAPLEHAAGQDAEPERDLVEPGGVLGRVEELDAVGRVGEEGRPRRHRPERARLAFHAQVGGDPAPFRDEADQGLGLVGVELVSEEEPSALGIGVDRPGDVRREVGRGAGRPERGGQDRAGGDVAGGDEAAGAVADGRVLAPLGAAGARRFARGRAFERLDAGHLVGADDVTAQRFQHRRVGIDGADGLDLRREGGGVLSGGLGVAPVAAAVRLEIGLHLRSAPRCAGKSCRQCLV